MIPAEPLKLTKFAPHFGPGQARAGQRGVAEVRIREVGPAQVRAGQVGLVV